MFINIYKKVLIDDIIFIKKVPVIFEVILKLFLQLLNISKFCLSLIMNKTKQVFISIEKTFFVYLLSVQRLNYLFEK